MSNTTDDELRDKLIPFEMVLLTYMELAYPSTDEARKATEVLLNMAKGFIKQYGLEQRINENRRVVDAISKGDSDFVSLRYHEQRIEELNALKAKQEEKE